MHRGSVGREQGLDAFECAGWLDATGPGRPGQGVEQVPSLCGGGRVVECHVESDTKLAGAAQVSQQCHGAVAVGFRQLATAQQVQNGGDHRPVLDAGENEESTRIGHPLVELSVARLQFFEPVTALFPGCQPQGVLQGCVAIHCQGRHRQWQHVAATAGDGADGFEADSRMGVLDPGSQGVAAQFSPVGSHAARGSADPGVVGREQALEQLWRRCVQGLVGPENFQRGRFFRGSAGGADFCQAVGQGLESLRSGVPGAFLQNPS